MPVTPSIDVGYCGVHQAFQLALAAQDCGWLRTFHCSLYDAPGMFGALARRCFGSEALRNRRVEGLDPRKVCEYPWPWMFDTLCRRLGARSESMVMFESFDKHCARQLERDPPDLFAGTERNDLKTLLTAKRLGVRTLHDCPQLHPDDLEVLLRQAADACNLRWEGFPDGEAMKVRKLQEYELADRLLVYSDFHAQSFLRQGIARERLFLSPLWVDSEFWQPVVKARSTPASDGILKLLFVGEFSLRKGLPFLLNALDLLDAPVRLTLAGQPTGQVVVPTSVGQAEIIITGPLTKHRLRELYAEQDLLVLPSIADSFGFVALEAMACGVPVLLSENCGAPVPDPTWRVPACDSRAIAARLQHYVDQPVRVAEDASVCRSFAALFTPQRFRDRVRVLYQELLG